MSRKVTFKLIPVASAIFLCIFGCNAMKTTSTASLEADKAAILAADAAWSKSAMAADKSEFNNLLLEDAKMLAPNTPIADGKAAFIALTGAMFAMPGFTIEWTPTSATVAGSGDLGYSMGTYKMGVNDADGNPQSESGKYLTIWKKQADGTWMVAIDVFNSDTVM